MYTMLTIQIVFYGDGAQERNGGNYDVFAYRYHGYAKVARNVLEYPSSSALYVLRPQSILTC